LLNLIKKIEIILFYLFVFSIPLEKRHVFETSVSRIDGHFIEWNSAALYLSDILFGLLILFWILRFLFSLKDKNKKNNSKSIKTLVLIFSLFILISLVSAINSQFINLSLYYLTKIVEYGLIFFYIIINIKTTKKIIYALFTFIFSGLLQAILGIAQYLKQSSFNLKIFGEVDLSPTLQNISKIDVFGEKMIRAYGTFPHSNVLACFLFISIIFTICIMFIILNKESVSKKSLTYLKINKIFHIEHLLPLALNKVIYFIKLPIFVLTLYILTLGLLLTFSRSGWLASLISILFIILSILFLSSGFRKLLSSQFKKNFSIINIIIVLILFIIVTTTIFWPQITSRSPDSNPQDSYSISGRKLYNHLASIIIKDNLLLGTGPGLFVNYSGQYLSENFEWWQMQPVHNVYLLILAENGLLGFIAFFISILYVLSQIRHFNFKQKGNYYINQILIISLSSILFSFFIIMLFDHYLWDIQQGALCFFVVLGMFYSSIKPYKNT
jgi:O-antigen ligase